MDPLAFSLTITAIFASVSSVTLNSLEFLRRADKSSSVLVSQVDEIQVLRDVLEECYSILQTGQNPRVTQSVDRALRICKMRSEHLQATFGSAFKLDLISHKRLTKLKNIKTLMVTENERKAAIKGFRSAVLLLRDLCSEIRLQHQLVEMSAGLAALLADRYDEATSQTVDAPQPDHIYIDGEESYPTAEEHDHSTLLHSIKPQPKNKVGREWTDLIRQNFTRNATIVIDDSTGGQSKRVTLRAKMDTGCNDNLITLEVFEKFGMDKSMLVELPEEDQFDLEMLEGARCTILYKIHLVWYYDGDMKMRHSDFFVVKTGPFDMLIGSHRFAQEFAEQDRQGLVAGKKSKKKAIREKARHDHEAHLNQQKILELQERNSQHAQAALQSLREQSLRRAQESPQHPVPPSQTLSVTSPGRPSQTSNPTLPIPPVTQVSSSTTQQREVGQGQNESSPTPIPHRPSASPATIVDAPSTLLPAPSNSTSAPALSNTDTLHNTLADSSTSDPPGRPGSRSPALALGTIAEQATGKSTDHESDAAILAPVATPAHISTPAIAFQSSTSSDLPSAISAQVVPPPSESRSQTLGTSAPVPQHHRLREQSSNGTGSRSSTSSHGPYRSDSAGDSISAPSQQTSLPSSNQHSDQHTPQLSPTPISTEAAPNTKRRGKVFKFFKRSR